MNGNDSRITACCPSGHRLQGDIKLMGKSVRCPKCQVEFVFAPPKEIPADDRPSVKPKNRAVTESGVMRILGDMEQVPPPPKMRNETKSCAKCGRAISQSYSVCPHCKCYVGVMPRFMNELCRGTDLSKQ